MPIMSTWWKAGVICSRRRIVRGRPAGSPAGWVSGGIAGPTLQLVELDGEALGHDRRHRDGPDLGALGRTEGECQPGVGHVDPEDGEADAALQRRRPGV